MGEDLVIDAFTDLAPRYEAAMDKELAQVWNITYASLVRRMVELVDLQPGELSLDIATGTSRISIALAEQATPVRGLIGLDVTPAMLFQAKRRLLTQGLGSAVRLVCASAMEMPFAGATFDVAICGFGMHHLQTETALKQMRRLLKVGGRIALACVSFPGAWRSSIGDLLVRFAAWVYGTTHRGDRARVEIAAIPQLLAEAEWLSLLSEQGFERIRIAQRLPGRLPVYPSALILTAKRGAP